jgi:hypothetical protein
MRSAPLILRARLAIDDAEESGELRRVEQIAAAQLQLSSTNHTGLAVIFRNSRDGLLFGRDCIRLGRSRRGRRCGFRWHELFRRVAARRLSKMLGELQQRDRALTVLRSILSHRVLSYPPVSF